MNRYEMLLDLPLNRREFLFLGAAATNAGRLALFAKEKYQIPDWINNPDKYEFYARNPLPPKELLGLWPNTPFMHLEDHDIIKYYLDTYFTKHPGISELHEQIIDDYVGVRILIDDRYEPELGKFNKRMLGQIRQYAQMLDDRGLQLRLDLIDGFTFQDHINPLYVKKINKATCPYVAHGLRAAYSHKDYIEAFKRRIDMLSVLNNISNLKVIGVGNELPVPDGDLTLYGDWHNITIPIIDQAFPNQLLISGCDHPSKLPNPPTELDMHSLHNYFPLGVSNLPDNIPIWLEEIGALKSMAWMLEPIAVSTLNDSSVVNGNRVGIRLCNIGPWHISRHKDNLLWNPWGYKRANRVFHQFCEIQKKMAA